MKKLLILLPLFALVLLLSLSTHVKSADEDEEEDKKEQKQKIEICHARSNHNNPYGRKRQSVSIRSIIKNNGHDSHDGPVWYSGIAGKWGDIIPSFEYKKKTGSNKTTETLLYPGKNLTPAGLAIWENNCQIPALCLFVNQEVDLIVGQWSEGWKTNEQGLYKERTLTYFDLFFRTEECPEDEYYYQCDEEVAVESAWTAWTKTEDGKKETRQTVATVDSLDSEVVCSTATETRDVTTGTVIGEKDEVKEEEKGEVKAAYTTAVPLAETSGPNNSLAYIIQGILSLSLLATTSLLAKTNLLGFLKRF